MSYTLTDAFLKLLDQGKLSNQQNCEVIDLSKIFRLENPGLGSVSFETPDLKENIRKVNSQDK
jgi:hypothetical protein